jgi:hypothetical protein
VTTQATRLGDAGSARPATCWQAVQLYASREAIRAPFLEIAFVTVEAPGDAADSVVAMHLRRKAATLGANGLLLTAITGRPVAVTSNFRLVATRQEGEGVALWIPRDSLRAIEKCTET